MTAHGRVMEHIRLPLLCLTLLHVACTDADSDPELQGRYEHQLFADPDDCPDDPLFNCTPTIELCPDGEAIMLVTDILNTGTHERRGATVVTEWEVGDVPPSIELTISGDELELVDDWQGWTWTLAEAGSSFCP
jgi:hypothetical protein